MGARVFSVIHGIFLAFRRTRRIAINVSFSGVARIALEYEKHIQGRLYEAVRIWRLKAPLGTERNSFCLTFFPWTLWVVSFPRLRLLYKSLGEEHSSYPLALEFFGSSRFPLFLDKKDAAWTMGVAAEAKRIGAKVPPILQLDKKEHSPPSTKNCSQRELY